MSKHKILILVSKEIIAGFQLTGVEVEAVETAQEAEAVINNALMTGQQFGIIGIDTTLNAGLSKELLEQLDDRGYPILVPFRASELYQWEEVTEQDNYTAQLIKNAIGYDIKI